MNHKRPNRSWTGFFTGAIIGIISNFAFRTLYNLYCTWQGCTLREFSFWKMIPLPLLLGIFLAILIDPLVLGD